ncbi:MAG: NAD-dependent epimerase/dehydratase family protein [Solirubrobacteraceae bacterium]
MNRVLVTGAAGNVGTAVLKHLIGDARYELRASDQRELASWVRDACQVHQGDLRDFEEARRAMQGCTHVIHLAAIVGGIGNFHQKAHTLSEVNSALNNAVFRAAIDLGVERFVYMSSSMVFENAEEFPTTEAYLPKCPTPYSAYGFSKLAGEVYCRAADEQYGFPYTICRPGNAYGPGEEPAQEAGIKHVIPDLIGKGLSGQQPLQILGQGNQTRAFTFLEDTAEGIVTAMSSEAGLREDFNITSQEEIAIADLAEIVWEACGKDPAEFKLERLPQPYRTDVQRRILSSEKAERILGWKASVPLREGVKLTADWMAAERAASTR